MSRSEFDTSALSPEEVERLQRRSAALEEENNRLSNLYVASCQLHSTLNLTEVVRVIVEILINLVGGERFAVYALDEKTRRLEPLAGEDGRLEGYPRWVLGQGAIGSAIASGQIFYREKGPEEGGDTPIVCVPLCVKDRVVGAIAIFGWLPQKQGLTALDEELFRLLAGHSATAMLAARLYSESERKRQTMQGFLDLLTK